jgi:hypothetical protein
MSIKLKLRLSFLCVILISALGSLYSFVLIEKSKEYVRYKEQVLSILNHVKDARIEEKDFIIFDRKRTNFLEYGQSNVTNNHQQIIESIHRQIDSLNTHLSVTDAVFHTQLLALRSAIVNYEKDFKRLTKLYHERGFKDYGLEGSMRKNVHDLQQCVGAEEQVYAFSLRRHEKDFMLRKDLEYYHRIKETAEAFQHFVAEGSLPHMNNAYKIFTIEVIDKYVEKFSQLVELEKKIGLTEQDGVSGDLAGSAQSLLPIAGEMFRYIDVKSSVLQARAGIVLIISIFLTIGAGVLISFKLDQVISRPIVMLNQEIQNEIEGKSRTEALERISNKDEIGALTQNFKKMMSKLDLVLAEIREKNIVLERASQHDRLQKWIAEEVSLFVDIMKNNGSTIEDLTYTLISGLVKKIEANQGAIFLIDNQDNKEKLELTVAYAYDRRKFIKKEVFRGEGLIGAAWVEKEIVVLNKVPDNYISITSGLGHATADKLIIVPMMYEKQVYGVMEIASFSEFDDHHIELLKRTCDRFASYYDAMLIQIKTMNLLRTSQLQAEELKAQEEEMRQNLEEMAATQEDYARREDEYKGTIEKLNNENAGLRKMLGSVNN